MTYTYFYCFLWQPHLVLGLISQIIKVSTEMRFTFFMQFNGHTMVELLLHHLKSCFTYYQIQLLADLNLKKTPQLVELFDDSKVSRSVLPLFQLPVYIFAQNKIYFIAYCTGYRWSVELVTRKDAASMDEPSSEKGWLQENCQQFLFGCEGAYDRTCHHTY